MNKIVHITNFAQRAVVDGGTNREDALRRFLASHGAVHLTVCDEPFRRAKLNRATRLKRLLDEISQAKPDLVVMDYPSYPFFWQYKVTPYLLQSLLFSKLLHRAAIRHGFSIVIDVMDLPVFQYADLGFALEMSPNVMHRFDHAVFGRAHFLWVCSNSLTNTISSYYNADQSRLIPVLNGHQIELSPSQSRNRGKLRFAYAGSLDRKRWIGQVIDSFLATDAANTELRLCGSGGDWIAENYSDPRIVYLGELTDQQAATMLSDCDLGLIPYPEQGYYNLAFATKLAFYVGLGLPVLCSNAEETAGHVRRLKLGICRPLSEFGQVMGDIARNPEQLGYWRENVMGVREGFSWASIYSNALEETFRRRKQFSEVNQQC